MATPPKRLRSGRKTRKPGVFEAAIEREGYLSFAKRLYILKSLTFPGTLAERGARMTTIRFLLLTARSFFSGRSGLLLENLALRQQWAVMKNSIKRPRLRLRDRLFWILLSRAWAEWRCPLVIVKPATVIAWHREGFRLFWKRKSRKRGPGRPRVSKELRDLVRRMGEANPTWGAPRIHGELMKLDIEVSERTVSNLIPGRTKPPSQTWRTFLKNHMHVTCAIDFFAVPTVHFRILFVLIILEHSRRGVVHFNVTEHPCAPWTAQQVVEAFPWESAPAYLLRDRDRIYSSGFRRRVRGLAGEIPVRHLLPIFRFS